MRRRAGASRSTASTTSRPGRIMGEQAIKLLNGKGKVALITSMGATNLQRRLEGAARGARRPRPASRSSRPTTSRKTPCAAPRSSPPARAAIPTSAPGCRSAAGRSSRATPSPASTPSKTKVISFDTVESAIDLLREGKVQVLLGQKYFGWGSEPVKILHGIKNGKPAGQRDHRLRRRHRHERERRRLRRRVQAPSIGRLTPPD